MIQAIETRYAGCRFRSRLEARWAVFFDTLGIEWVYEPEGFVLDGEYYLPDFRLEHLDCFVEVKPAEPSERESLMAELLTKYSEKDVFIIGQIPSPEVVKAGCCDWGYRKYWGPNGGYDWPYIWCVCPWCRKIGIEFDGRGARVCGWRKHFGSEQEARAASPEFNRVDDKCYTFDNESILIAYATARSARFEFGEAG